MNNYSEVPNIIGTKDLDYLSDIFSWNYGAYKNSINTAKNIEDEELKKTVEKSSNIFNDNMKQILEILGDNYE